MIKKNDKKGISPVIATVLLLVLTIASVGIIAPFMKNFVQSNLEEGKSCFDILDGIEFMETGYNCNNISSVGERTGFSVKVNKPIEGFRVALYKDGNAESFEIKNGSVLSNIRMLNSDFSAGLVLPEKGGAKTYVANGIFSKIEIAPIVGNGNICDIADSINIEGCFDNNVINGVSAY